MKEYNIKGTDDQPQVLLNKKKAIFEISGKSLPEDVSKFYEPILTWFEEYSYDPLPKTVLNVRMTYFNTSSSRLLLDIFLLLEEMSEKDPEVEINWYYPDYDEDIKEAGIEYSEMVDIKFNFIKENIT